MIDKPIDQIDASDLENLKLNSITEGKTIEYKEMLPGNSDSDKKEFLADISSFANTIGGLIIYGVKEEKGVAKEICGISIDNSDNEILRLESIIRDGIEPRNFVSSRAIDITNGKCVLIIKISKSWINPHRVIFRGHDKFYARNSAGKYPLDTMELRRAFNLSETIIEKIKNFRIERISSLVANDTPIPFVDGAKIVLHLIPLESFTNEIQVDVIQFIHNSTNLNPIYCSGWNTRINLDGCIAYDGSRNEPGYSYVQIYRNGIIEAVNSSILYHLPEQQGKIPSLSYEQELIKILPQYINLLRDEGINFPIYMFITLTGVKGYKMGVDEFYYNIREPIFIDRDILNLPESIIESFDIDPIKILRPMFDLIWNACGYIRSFNFDDNGNWIGNKL